MADIFSPDQKSVKLRGKIRYAQGLGKLDYKFDEHGKYTCVLYLDSDSLEMIREMQLHGLQNKLKKDEDGYHVSLSRPGSKVFDGIRKEFGAPKITGPQGRYVTPNEIGNGSDVECTLEVYKWKPRGGNKYNVAMRLSSVDVHELIEFTPIKKDPEPEEF